MTGLKRIVKDWRVKGIVQAALSVAPGGRWVNDRLQTAMGGLRDFDWNVNVVDDWCGIMKYLSAVGRRDLHGKSLLEIGTGWCPTLPICFFLSGAGSVWTFDLRRLIDEPRSFQMLRALERHIPRISSVSGEPEAAVRARYERLRECQTLDRLLAVAGVQYRAPQDASNIEILPDGSLDMVFSNSVFEHVLPPVIPKLLRESWRLLKSDGIIVHAIACNDHYAHFDKRISYVNYLQFTDQEWRLWNCSLNYQNRLRAPDFIRMATDAGFRILHEARAVRPGSREALETFQLAPQFAHYSKEDLATTTVDFVALKVS